MSETISMTIEIGSGTLAESLVPELLDTLEEINVYEGPTTPEEFKSEADGKSTIQWGGTSNYGLCNDLLDFLKKHDIGYIHHTDAKDEYDAMTTWWVPGMKEETVFKTDADGTCMIDAEEVRPLVDLLLAMSKDGPKALPLFLGNENLEHLVEKGLKNPFHLHDLLTREVNKHFPSPPALTPLIISE